MKKDLYGIWKRWDFQSLISLSLVYMKNWTHDMDIFRQLLSCLNSKTNQIKTNMQKDIILALRRSVVCSHNLRWYDEIEFFLSKWTSNLWFYLRDFWCAWIYIQVCKYFLEAVEKKQYGWFWVCPNGGKDCHYRHALPPGYVLKSQMKALLEEESEKMPIEEEIENEVTTYLLKLSIPCI